ncbi:phage Gp37/Gp68 family protein [Gordonia oryzae]|uniref:Phage Gp37/Gp68 family protein n=1 Tax=Gordonia oryzae TaxID=2487349 RepID=A0A3N4GY57_9ACTN|nr:phage Gp37/Gp68 family protein [Gordonia oryzae]RPA65778.1 phage Gp37/Gp68 family protein [Gordonia oryzae]
MADHTDIEWTDRTWNPVTGCAKVSPGCDHCYAEGIAERFRGGPAFPNGFDVQLRPHKLTEPLRWRKPSKVFANSMSDLFHDSVPDEYIAQVFAVMVIAEHHTFQVLTKRHGRMRSLLSRNDFWRSVYLAAIDLGADDPADVSTIAPPSNVWLGVSTENQQWADIRIPALLDTPAAVRFVSAEPLLGPIELEFVHYFDTDCNGCSGIISPAHEPACGNEPGRHWGIDWVIVGGESGPKARPMHPDWARSLRDQCAEAGVPFHFKQWGEWVPESANLHAAKAAAAFLDLDGTVRPLVNGYPTTPPMSRGEAITIRRVGKKRAGRVLDGRTWDQFPGGEA